jgi:outer membrane protein insertion porin family/translocation and assembly module TamA
LPLPEVKRITFEGNTHFSDAQLRSVMVTKPPPILPPWKRGEPYNRPTVNADLRRVKKFYFDRGFLDANVQLGEVEEDTEAGTVRLTILIDEGPETMVEEVRLAGTIPPELATEASLRALLPLQAETRLTKAAFEASRTLLLSRLQEAGYARAQVVPRTEVDLQAHRAIITYTLTPGKRTTFGRITVTGAKQVKEPAIRRKLTMREGLLYNPKALTESTDAVYELGMFQSVTPRALNFDDALEEPLDVDVEVRERKPRSIGFGIGFSTVESIRMQVQWSHYNLFRGAQRFTTSAKISGVQQGLDASLHFPYFLGRRNTLTLSAFSQNEQKLAFGPFNLLDDVFLIEDPQPSFDLLRVGGEARMGRRLSRTVHGFAGLELSLNDFRNVDAEAIAASGADAADDNILLIQFAEVRWDTSDSLLNPTRGMLIRARVDHANTSVFSDVNFAKVALEGRHYLPLWWGIILATRLEIGGIQPYGESDSVPFNVRFYAGGPGSVRGFTLNRLGPLDSEGEPIGGQSLLEGSVEFRFPIAGNFGGVLFVDFGNVFPGAFSYDVQDLRYAVGPGVRYNTPIGPFRLDVGFIVDRRTGEDLARFELSIGQAF